MQFQNILLLGKPASGKGTFSQSLKNNYTQISTGDILREEIKKETELGLYIKSKIDNGHFIDNETMLKLLKKNLPSDKRLIFDGYPRNKDQIKYFEELIKGQELLVIYLDIPEKVLFERIEGRRVCEDCGEIYNTNSHTALKAMNDNQCDCCGGNLIKRKDDALETFKERLNQYKEQTVDVVNYYTLNAENFFYIKSSEALEELIQELF